MFSARVVRLIAGKVGYTVSCFLAAVLLVVAGYAHKAVADLRRARRRDHDRRQLVRRRDEHPGDGPGEPHQLPGAVPVRGPADRDARGQRRLLRGSDGRLPGHRHADPGAHLRGRAEGGRLLDPARRPGHLSQGVLRRHHHREDRPGLLLRVRHLAELDLRLVHELQRALPAGQPGRPGGRDRDRRVGHRRAHRQLRGDEPGRLLHAGPGLRRHRGLRHADDGERHRRRQPVRRPRRAGTRSRTATT